jgi:4-hydroxy-tetrahydrodipicolinate reductase
MIKLAISGCRGRMGQRISFLASQDKAFRISTLLEHASHPEIGQKFFGAKVSADAAELKHAQVLIEFTSPEATIEHLKACQKTGVGMVIGTTGLTPVQVRTIKLAARKIPIVLSSNMSVGVNLVFGLIREAAHKAAGQYQIRIVEAHHIHKKDAPSGTAKTMAQVAEESSRQKVLDIQSIREGEIIGDHDVIFESPVDTFTIRHHAKTRDIFAAGSLVAAKFLAKKTKGLFSMEEVLANKS